MVKNPKKWRLLGRFPHDFGNRPGQSGPKGPRSWRLLGESWTSWRDISAPRWPRFRAVAVDEPDDITGMNPRPFGMISGIYPSIISGKYPSMIITQIIFGW